MNVEMDERRTLVKIVNIMDDSDIQKMLAYAAGYEAGKISQMFKCENIQQHKALELPNQNS